MEKYERIKHLRKNVLKLTQEEFATALGISRSNIGNIEVGRINITNRVIQDICLKYSVNETWLNTGAGEIFIKSKQTILDELVAAHGLTEKETRIIQAFLSLSPQGRAGVLEYVENLTSLDNSRSPREKKIVERINAADKIIAEDQKIHKS